MIPQLPGEQCREAIPAFMIDAPDLTSMTTDGSIGNQFSKSVFQGNIALSVNRYPAVCHSTKNGNGRHSISKADARRDQFAQRTEIDNLGVARSCR